MKDKFQNEIIETIVNYSINKAKEIYGDLLDKTIVKRIEDEAKTLVELGIDDFDLLQVSIELNNLNKKGITLIPRTSLCNSLIYYLYEITNVNPLPRHSYCPKCHTFKWGDENNDMCPECGEKIILDGYDLPFALLKDDIKKIKFKFDYSSNVRYIKTSRNYEIRLFVNPLLQLASELGLKQEDINLNNLDSNEIIKCLDNEYYIKHYLKSPIFEHKAFIGLPTLGSNLTHNYLDEFVINNFDELVDLISMMHGTKVYDSCKKFLLKGDSLNINDCITSRDDLFKFLKLNEFNDEDAVILCRETRINGSGHLSSLSETKLKEGEVEEKYINFIKDIRYIFHKGHVVGHTKLEFIIAKIFLEDPIRYYRAYFSIHKDLINQINENDDLIKRLAEARNYELEKIYLGMIDLMERGFNPKKLINEIKNKKE